MSSAIALEALANAAVCFNFLLTWRMSMTRAVTVLKLISALAIIVPATLFFTLQASAQSPALIQVADDLDWAETYLGSGGSVAAGQYVTTELPNPALAGNMIVVIVPFDATSSVPTVTDNLGESYSLAKSCTDTTHGEEIGIYYALNVAAGAKQIKTTYHAGTQNQGNPAVAEFTNLATSNALDVASCNSANSTTVAAGSATPTQTGDLVIQFAWNDYVGLGSGGGVGVHYTQGNQSNITWQQFLGTWAWAEGAQWGVYNSTSALNPTMTTSSSGFLSLAVFFKSASAGTAMPSGIRIVGRKNVPFTNYSSWNANPLTVYFPCPSTANLLIADFAGAGQDMTAVSDSNSNGWTSSHALACDSGNNTCVHNWYAPNATTTTGESVKFSFNSMQGADSVELYCVKGAATSPLDTSIAGTGNQTASGNWTSVSITPTTSNGLILMDGSQYSDTASGFTTGLYEGCFWSSESLSNGGCASNNAWGAYYNPNTSQFSWTATELPGVAVGIWAAETDAFKAASTQQPPPPTQVKGQVVQQQ